MNLSRATCIPRTITAIIVIVASLLSSCGYSNLDSPARSSIVLWYSTNGVRERILLDLIDQWNVTGHGFLVIPEHIPVDTYHKRVLEGSARGALPSLMLISNSQAAVYAKGTIIVPLDTFMADGGGDQASAFSATDLKDFFPFVLAAGRTPQGLTFGMPQGGLGRIMLYNLDLLRSLNLKLSQAPDDWETFGTTCARVSDPSRGLTCMQLESSATTLTDWLLTGAAKLVSASGEYQLNSEFGRTAVDRLRMLLSNGQAYTGADAATLVDDFASARSLYAFDWSDRIPVYKAAVKDRDNFEIGLGNLPNRVSGSSKEQANLQVQFAAPLWSIARGDRRSQTMAWKFISWMLSASVSSKWSLATGDVPARRSAIAGAESIFPGVAGAIAPVWQMVGTNAVAMPLLSGIPCTSEPLAAALRGLEDVSRTTADILDSAQTAALAQLDTDCATP